MTANSFQTSDCCIAKFGLGTQLVTGMIIDFFFLLNKIWTIFANDSVKMANAK